VQRYRGAYNKSRMCIRTSSFTAFTVVVDYLANFHLRHRRRRRLVVYLVNSRK